MLIEIFPNRWVVARVRSEPARSALPVPYVISDEMPPVEQVDGRFYTSKAKFRSVGRAHGLTEVGTEKLKPKQRASADPLAKLKRRETLKLAAEKFKAGYRVRTD